MERNCSVLLNISLFHSDKSGAECPLWFNRDNQTGLCTAGPTLNGIVQQDMSTFQTSIIQCYCMTEEDGVLAIGFCPHKCLSITSYYQLPCQVSQLQNYTCPPNLKSNGTLCRVMALFVLMVMHIMCIPTRWSVLYVETISTMG